MAESYTTAFYGLHNWTLSMSGSSVRVCTLLSNRNLTKAILASIRSFIREIWCLIIDINNLLNITLQTKTYID